MSRIHLAATNPGKVREFREAAQALSIALDPLPRMAEVPPAVEDGITFEQNARIKAEYYSHLAPGELVLAEDSGLAVDALNGAPGVHSARYAGSREEVDCYQNPSPEGLHIGLNVLREHCSARRLPNLNHLRERILP